MCGGQRVELSCGSGGYNTLGPSVESVPFADHFANSAAGRNVRLVKARLVAYTVLLGWNQSLREQWLDPRTDVPMTEWFIAAANRWIATNRTIPTPGSRAKDGVEEHHLGTRGSIDTSWIGNNFRSLNPSEDTEANGRPIVRALDRYARGTIGVARVVQEVKELTFEPMLIAAVRETRALTADRTLRVLAMMGALSSWSAMYPDVARLGQAAPPTVLLMQLRNVVDPAVLGSLERLAVAVIGAAARPNGAPLAGLNVARAALLGLHLSTEDHEARRAQIMSSLAQLISDGTGPDLELAEFLQMAIDDLHLVTFAADQVQP